MRDESLVHDFDFEWEKEIRNLFFDSDSLIPIVFFFVISKVATSASLTQIFYIIFYFLLNQWYLFIKILTIIIQTNMKDMLVYLFTGQIEYVIIEIGYVIIEIVIGNFKWFNTNKNF